MKIDIENLIGQLKGHVVEIGFTKADGTKRIMQATLSSHILSAAGQKLPESSETNQTLLLESGQPKDLIKVWDCQMHAWRSLHPSTIYSINNIQGA